MLMVNCVQENQVDEVVLAQAIVGDSDDELDEGDESDGN